MKSGALVLQKSKKFASSDVSTMALSTTIKTAYTSSNTSSNMFRSKARSSSSSKGVTTNPRYDNNNNNNKGNSSSDGNSNMHPIKIHADIDTDSAMSGDDSDVERPVKDRDSPIIRIEMKKKSAGPHSPDEFHNKENNNARRDATFSSGSSNLNGKRKEKLTATAVGKDVSSASIKSSMMKLVKGAPLLDTMRPNLTLADLPDSERTKVTRILERLVSLGRENEDLVSEISSLRARHASELDDANSTAAAAAVHWESRVASLLISLEQNEEKRSSLLGLIKAYQNRLQTAIETIEKLSKSSDVASEKSSCQESSISSLELEIKRLEQLVDSQKNLLSTKETISDSNGRNAETIQSLNSKLIASEKRCNEFETKSILMENRSNEMEINLKLLQETVLRNETIIRELKGNVDKNDALIQELNKKNKPPASSPAGSLNISGIKEQGVFAAMALELNIEEMKASLPSIIGGKQLIGGIKNNDNMIISSTKSYNNNSNIPTKMESVIHGTTADIHEVSGDFLETSESVSGVLKNNSEVFNEEDCFIVRSSLRSVSSSDDVITSKVNDQCMTNEGVQLSLSLHTAPSPALASESLATVVKPELAASNHSHIPYHTSASQIPLLNKEGVRLPRENIARINMNSQVSSLKVNSSTPRGNKAADRDETEIANSAIKRINKRFASKTSENFKSTEIRQLKLKVAPTPNFVNESPSASNAMPFSANTCQTSEASLVNQRLSYDSAISVMTDSSSDYVGEGEEEEDEDEVELVDTNFQTSGGVHKPEVLDDFESSANESNKNIANFTLDNNSSNINMLQDRFADSCNDNIDGVALYEVFSEEDEEEDDEEEVSNMCILSENDEYIMRGSIDSLTYDGCNGGVDAISSYYSMGVSKSEVPDELKLKKSPQGSNISLPPVAGLIPNNNYEGNVNEVNSIASKSEVANVGTNTTPMKPLVSGLYDYRYDGDSISDIGNSMITTMASQSMSSQQYKHHATTPQLSSKTNNKNSAAKKAYSAIKTSNNNSSSNSSSNNSSNNYISAASSRNHTSPLIKTDSRGGRGVVSTEITSKFLNDKKLRESMEFYKKTSSAPLITATPISSNGNSSNSNSNSNSNIAFAHTGSDAKKKKGEPAIRVSNNKLNKHHHIEDYDVNLLNLLDELNDV